LKLVVLREIAPLVTAFIVHGRSGAAMATELAGIKERGEVRALYLRARTLRREGDEEAARAAAERALASAEAGGDEARAARARGLLERWRGIWSREMWSWADLACGGRVRMGRVEDEALNLMKLYLCLMPLVLLVGACEEDKGVEGGEDTGAEVEPGAGGEDVVEGDAVDTEAGAGQGEAGEGVKGDRPEDEDFVGLKVEDGKALAEKHRIPARVVKIDGESLFVTQDYVEERVNFTVVKGVITEVERG